jgi:hypothetical protein
LAVLRALRHGILEKFGAFHCRTAMPGVNGIEKSLPQKWSGRIAVVFRRRAIALQL